ncbi:glycosyltransferase family 39 protein, partial [Patescibacteria group bacterium]|nr:glycosyltransferase family 39 protein [Patescibacteria group bacterium]MBU1867980.1 glycosyltransferase family 39 protein [Patescibacteria group bacterium]
MDRNQRLLFPALIFITVTAFILRFYQVASNPPGFFCDEASIGYNAYSLLTTGKDEHSQPWPIFFRAFGEFKNPVAIYSTIPALTIFGLNETGVRFVSVIYGSLTVLIIYLLGKELRNPQTGLIAAFLLTISPWHIHFSRIAFECVSFLFFTSLSLYLFIRATKGVKSYLPWSFLFFAIGLYTYTPSRVFIPLFLPLLIAIFWNKVKVHRTQFILSLLLFLALITPLAIHLSGEEGWARAKQISIFSNAESFSSITTHIGTKYLLAFSPNYLFKFGDTDMPGQFVTRHSVKGTGELYWFQLPFLIAGFFYLWKQRRKALSKMLISWITLYPLADALTVSTLQSTHLIIGVLPLQLITALGADHVLAQINHLTALRIKKAVLILFTTLFCTFGTYEITRYLTNFFTHYPLESAGYYGWQYGPREIISYFQKNNADYEELIMDYHFNSPGIFFKFYAPENYD